MEIESRLNHHFASLVVAHVLILLLFILGFCQAQPGGLAKGHINMTQPAPEVDLQEQVNKEVTAGLTNVFMNTDIVFEDGKGLGNLLIQNVETNPAPVFVEIYTKDTNALVYKSYEIPVGYKIEEDKLNTALDKGTYPCVAYFNVLDPSSNEVQSRIGINVTITVNN